MPSGRCLGRRPVSVELGGGDAKSGCGCSGVQTAVPYGHDELGIRMELVDASMRDVMQFLFEPELPAD